MQHAWVKRRQAQAAAPPVTEKDTRRQLAWAAGSEFFSHRDPLYHITEDFQQAFDEIGGAGRGERRWFYPHGAGRAAAAAGGTANRTGAGRAKARPDQREGPVSDALAG